MTKEALTRTCSRSHYTAKLVKTILKSESSLALMTRKIRGHRRDRCETTEGVPDLRPPRYHNRHDGVFRSSGSQRVG